MASFFGSFVTHRRPPSSFPHRFSDMGSLIATIHTSWVVKNSPSPINKCGVLLTKIPTTPNIDEDTR